jgi:hypothetical protein
VILQSGENDIEYARVIEGQPWVFQSSGVFENLAAGSYHFIGRKAGNPSCQSESLEVVVEDPADCGEGPLTVQAGGVTASTCSSAADGKLQVMVSGGVPPYRYYWDGSPTATGALAEALSGGSHSVIVYDAVNASVTLSLTVPVLAPLSVETFTSLASCASSCDGEATVLVLGGSGSYSIGWSDGQTAWSRHDLCVGDHGFIVRDTRNTLCAVSGTAAIGHPPSLSLTTIKQSPTCPQGDDGSLRLQISGGSQRYTVSWSGGGSSLIRSGLRAGDYEVTITDQDLGCSLTEVLTLADPAPIEVVSATTTTPKCYGGHDGSIVLSLSNVTTPLIQWSTGQVGAQLTQLRSGSYGYIITGANGCQVSGNVVVAEPVALRATAQPQDPLCAGTCDGQITLSLQGGTAPYQVSWSNNARGLTARNLCAGDYTYTVTDQHNCKVSQTVRLASPAPVTVNSTAVHPGCYGKKDGSIVVSPSGGSGSYTYEWSSSSLTTASRSGLGRGAYTVTVRDAYGCAASKTITLTEPSVLHLGNDVVQAPTCEGASTGKITVLPSGGTAPYAYAWEDQNTQQSVREDLAAGTYRLTVSDARNCAVSKTYVLLPPQRLELVDVELTDPHCYGEANGRVSVQAQGGVSPYAYAWEGGAPSGPVFNNLKAGAYDLVLTDANGCTRQASYILADPERPQIRGIATETVICTGGEAILAPEGSWSRYLWSGPKGFTSTQAQLRTGEKGSYTLTAHDLRACPATISFTVVVSASALTADFLRISRAVAYEPIVFVDISTPMPEQTQWLVPDDADVLVNRQTSEMIEITFTRSGDFEIGLKATMGNCASTLYKVVTIEEKAEGMENENEAGRLREDQPVTLTLFPNPMREELTVQVSVPTRDAIALRMVSAVDSRVAAMRTFEGQHDYRITWSLPQLMAGVYQLLYEYNTTIYSKRIVVIR